MDIYPQGAPLRAMEFQPGDEFGVEGKGGLSSLIQYVVKGRTSHSGIITDKLGNTFEALSTIKRSHISAYIGQNVIIVRPLTSIKGVDEALRAISEKWEGKVYPGWRLALHLIDSVLPTFGKINLIGIPVCSEVVTYAEWKMGIRDSEEIWGVNPQELMNDWVFSPNHEIVYRGRLVA